MGMKGRPKFDIPVEQLLYLLENGFKVTDIARLMCVIEKTIYRRLQNNGMSVHSTYKNLTDEELDIIVKNILEEFPNCALQKYAGTSIVQRK